MSNKRYYWFKLHDDFFDDKRIKRLRQLAGGDTYTIIYLKMQLRALKTDGYLYFDNIVGDFYEEVALDINETVDNVKVTIQYLLSVNLLEVSPDGAQYLLTELQNNIGSETASAQRVRDHRSKKKYEALLQCNTEGRADKTLHCNTDVTKTLHCNTDVTKTLQCNADLLQSNENVTNVKQVCSAEIEIEKEKINISNTKALDILSDKKKMSDADNEPRKNFDLIISQWNSLESYGIQPIRIIGPTTERGRMLKSRLREFGEESFAEVVEQIKQSEFLQGKHEGRFWQVTFDWVVHPSNYAKVLEGNYRTSNKPQQQFSGPRNFVNIPSVYAETNMKELEEQLLDN